MNGDIWNPWHGCVKYSAGCKNCYVYRRDESISKDAGEIYRTSSFDLPLRKNRAGEYKISSGKTVYTCMTSDFFLPDADAWRSDIWNIIKLRADVSFFIITKRIVRFKDCIPDDWGDGYDNVTVCCTVENQKECDTRLPIFKSLPIKQKHIICEPLLSSIDMSRYLDKSIKKVIVGGESGNNARVCDYLWVLDIRRQCIEREVSFYFKQTGAKLLKDGKTYNIQRKFQHSQAKKANISISF